MSTAGILVITLFVLATGLLGLRDVIGSADFSRRVAELTALDLVESRAARIEVRLDVVLRRSRVGRRVARNLASAGVNVLTSTALMIVVGVGVLLTLIISALLSRYLAPLGLVIAGLAGNAYLERQRTQRLERFIAQLPELARTLSNAASAGLALRSAIALAGADLEDPAGFEMRRVNDQLALGSSTEDALRDLALRLPNRELGVLVDTLVISSRAGGSLVTSLRNIAETLEARKEVRREVKTVLAQSVYTGYLVVVLGVGILLLLNAISPGLFDLMLTRPLGQVALGVSAGLFSFGLFLVNRITRIDV